MKKGVIAFLLLMSISAPQAQEAKVTLIHTGDTHGRGMSESGIGYGKMSAYVKNLRQQDANVLFVDVGDAVSGMPVTDLTQGESNVRAMNTMGYDAFTPGNADFIFGGTELLSLRDKARFPFVSANIYYHDKLAFRPYVMKKMAGLNIAIIGVSPLNAMVATTDSKLAGFSVSDPIQAVRNTVAQVKGKSDLIIVLAHLGKTDPAVNISKLLEAVPEIDVLVDGHDHIAVQAGKQMGKTVMVNAGQYGDYLGHLTLTVKDKKIVAWSEKLLDAASLTALKADSETESCIEQARAASAEVLNKVVMALPFTLNGQRERVRSGQTNLGSLLADAEREYANADIAFTVGAFLRDSIPAGPVTYGEVLNALPFRLPLVTREMSGEQIKAFIEHNYAQQNIISGAYAHVSGLRFSVDFTRPAGDRMISIEVNGQPLARDKIYRVACNEQVSDFGIRDIAIRDRYDVPMAELLTEYVNKHAPLISPAPRVQFLHPAG